MAASLPPYPFTAEQKEALFRDGYVILRQVVPPDVVNAALKRIKAAKKVSGYFAHIQIYF